MIGSGLNRGYFNIWRNWHIETNMSCWICSQSHSKLLHNMIKLKRHLCEVWKFILSYLSRYDYNPGVFIIHESLLPMRASVSRRYLIVFFLSFTEYLLWSTRLLLVGCCRASVSSYLGWPPLFWDGSCRTLIDPPPIVPFSYLIGTHRLKWYSKIV